MEGGAPPARARLAMVMLHGRGGSPDDMLGLAEGLGLVDVTYVAPRAAGQSWWPQSFLAPLAANEPGVSSGLAAVADAVDGLMAAGIGVERIEVMGFSQGACLALEYAARAGRRFRGVAGLSGALLGTAEVEGPPSEALHGHAPKRFDYPGRLDGVPVFIGCHRHDPHIPLLRVEESAAAFERLGAAVTSRIYPGRGHGLVEDEIAHLRGKMNG